MSSAEATMRKALDMLDEIGRRLDKIEHEC